MPHSQAVSSSPEPISSYITESMMHGQRDAKIYSSHLVTELNHLLVPNYSAGDQRHVHE